ncbi:MAG: ComF family protein [Rickettsiales bacterium]|nr:ComF family protein [Rickettsiales bacterium]
MNIILQKFTNFILPPRCICGEKFLSECNSICSECFGEYCNSSNFECSKCGNPLQFDFGENALCAECIEKPPEFDYGRFVYSYNNFTKKIISRFKYSDKTFASKKISQLMAGKISAFVKNNQIDFVTSIPISRKKLLSRKYNQSAILALEISKIFQLKCDNQILYREKNVAPQASLSRQERLKNMKNVFAIKNKNIPKIKGKNILLVDDVITTGATLNEASKILKKAGVNRVFTITFAKTFLD